jgi:predicted ATP-dependent protease
MLRRDVIDAVEAGKFQVYPVDHVDQALALLTGLPAGEREENGEFTAGSLNRRICDRLVELSEQRRSFSDRSSKDEAPDAEGESHGGESG